MDNRDIALLYLGSGYDVCGEYADGGSIRRKLFDLDRVPTRYVVQLPNKSTDFYSVHGETVEEYQRKLTTRAGIAGAYGLFSGSVKASFNATDLSFTESSYASIELRMRYETWKLQTMATRYMYPDVLDDFRTKDGKWLIEVYGGGVVMEMDIGGRWSDNLAVSKLYENSTRDVVIAMEAAYTGLIAGRGSAEISETVRREKSIVSRRVNAIGGDPKFAPWKLEEWQASVQESPTFMDFTNKGLLPMWKLFPRYKAKLRDGFDQYLSLIHI